MSQQKQPKLTGLIVAHNEEAMIEDAFKSLHFCDEIVACLDRCSDGTKEIAKKYAHIIVETPKGDDHDWHIEGVRRNAGIEACTGDWILELDADERVNDTLAKSIRDAIQTDKEGWFLLPVDNFVGDKLVKNGWGGSFGCRNVRRLFSKGGKVWGHERVHPSIKMGKRLGHLEGAIVHYVDDNIDDMIDRLQRYTSARAEDMAGKPLPPFRTTVRRGLSRFLKSYFSREGYKEGRMGFLLGLMSFLFIVVSHIKAEVEYGAKPRGK